MSMNTAWGIVVVSSTLFIFVSTCINSLAGALAPVALMVVFGYSFTKRFTRFSHFFLGLALGIAPVGAWVAVRATLGDATPWLLALAVMCWVAGFDMIYAMQDEAFDRAHGLHSMVVALGPWRTLQFIRLLHGTMFLILVGVGLLLLLDWPYFAGMTLVAVSLAWEQWLMSRRVGNQGNLQRAFLQANALASFGYLAAVLFETVFRR
jgi:4-hydroxybenzoate polyprenyltransferase